MQTQFTPKLPNSSGYGQKKITQQTQPKNLPQGETFELTIDIVQDKVCLFAKKDGKLFEAIETLLQEKDIVNIVNQKPEVLIRNQHLQLRYEGFPIIELKQVEQYQSAQKEEGNNSNNNANNNSSINNNNQPQITVESMYSELNYQYKRDLQIQREFFEEKKRISYEELEEMKLRLSDLSRIKKEMRENEIISTLTTKIQLQEKEIETLPNYISLLESWENNQEKINQLVYLKMAHLIDVLQETTTTYYQKKQFLTSLFQQFQDDTRRLKSRKAVKEAEEFEKKIGNLEPEYKQLLQCDFFTMESYQQIDYQFLNCDETIVYKQQIVILQEQMEEQDQAVQIVQDMVLKKKKEFNEFKLSVDRVQMQTNDLSDQNQQLKREIAKKEDELKENSHWKDKFTEFQRITYEMQIKQDNRIKGLQSHVLIKDTQVRQLKKEVDEKEEELKRKKNFNGEKGQDERHRMLYEEISNEKKITSSQQEKIAKLQNELNSKRDQKARINAELDLINEQINELEESSRKVQGLLVKQYEYLEQIQKFQQENQQLSQQNKQLGNQKAITLKRFEQLNGEEKNKIENKIQLENQIELLNAFTRKKEAEIANLQLKLKLKKSY